MKIQLIKFKEDYVKPERKHYNDAGADVYILNKVRLFPNETKKIPLGFGMKLPDGFCALIVPRSGQASRGIVCQIPPIDSGYTGEIHAIVTNTTTQSVFLEKGERVGQILIVPCILADFVEELGEERGANGFNSTGK